MVYIKSIIIAVVVWFAVAFPLDELTRVSNEVGLFLSTAAAVIAFIISINNIETGNTASNIASETLGTIKDVKEAIESNVDSKRAEYFYLAEKEYEDGKIDKEAWSQALVKARGDENLRKVEYMKLRAKQLKKNKNS